MKQTVIYKGIVVMPQDRRGSRVLVRTTNQVDAQKAGLPFKKMDGFTAVFEDWVEESELVAVND